MLDETVVRGSRERLHRAVSNLLDNAVKWSPDGGSVEVRVADAAVSIRDHGPGIAEEDLPKVFDRFYRAVDARGLPGSGLGLAIVRQVAESHGGAVSAARAGEAARSSRFNSHREPIVGFQELLGRCSMGSVNEERSPEHQAHDQAHAGCRRGRSGSSPGAGAVAPRRTPSTPRRTKPSGGVARRRDYDRAQNAQEAAALKQLDAAVAAGRLPRAADAIRARIGRAFPGPHLDSASASSIT
jgi:hypothetical protein